MIDTALLERYRSGYPFLARGAIFLNHAGTGPLSTRVVEAMTAHLRARSEGEIETYWNDLPMVKELRANLALLIGAPSPDRIALQTNTSDALNVIASGLPLAEGDRILVSRAEFPANVWPWLNLQRHGVVIDWLPDRNGEILAEDVEAKVTPRTRVLAVSAVQFLSGARADLRAMGALCKPRGITFVVDGIQAVGAVRIDVKEMMIDALAAGSQKWQMAPHGSGFLYLTEELQERLQQAHLGWLSVKTPWDFKDYGQPLASSGRRYEPGSLNMPSLWGLHIAIGTLLEVGPGVIEEQVLALTGMLRTGLETIDGVVPVTPTDRLRRAGIVTSRLPSSAVPETVLENLQKRGITGAVREGLLRLSPHFYNSPDDMTATVEALRDILSNHSTAKRT